MESTIRLVMLILKDGIILESIPHQHCVDDSEGKIATAAPPIEMP